jgi:hypothetical protein
VNQASPALVEDQPVPDGECWFRVITNKRHITSDGSLHPQALRKGAFAQSAGKPWAHELSGDLTSLAGDIPRLAQERVDHARNGFVSRGQNVPSGVVFAGVACATAQELRVAVAGIPDRDVLYTPHPADNAHADVVTYGTTTDESLEPVRAWLITVLRGIFPQDIAARIGTCGRQAASAP